MKKSILLLGVFVLALSTLVSCSGKTVQLAPSAPDGGAPVIRADYKTGEITELCARAMDKAQKNLDVIAKTPSDARTVDKTLLAFENVSSDLTDETTPLSFMKAVTTSADLNKEAAECEDKVSQFYVAMMTRKDLYLAIKDTRESNRPRNLDEKRLFSETMKEFEKNGLKLSDKKIAQMKALKTELVSIENLFQTNLNTDQSSAAFTAAELQGAPESFLSRLKKDPQGRYLVDTSEPDYVVFVENVKSSEARKRMLVAFDGRAAEKNLPLLKRAIGLRKKIAKAMGYANWADYRIHGNMAENSKTVLKFLNGLKNRLKQKNLADQARLLSFKKESDPNAKRVELWDVRYLTYQLKKRDFTLDDEKIKTYFPADRVVQGMFEVYSNLLGVKFREVIGAPVWAPGVKQYEIRDARSDEVVAYFYTDFYPRPLKYGHAAAFPLTQGRMRGGSYQKPVAAIVANLSVPEKGKPSLLVHDDVETLFHEFGHVMHGTLTRAPYGSQAGTSVAQDFVEAPSQMLENWVWSPEVLKGISGDYRDPAQKLPDDLIARMIEVRHFNEGYFYTRQLVFALLDMKYHTQAGDVDPIAIYRRLMHDVQGVDAPEGDSFPSSFGHLMGGYDAGYYGYLWSEVFAQDMFSRFKAEGITNPAIGARYRKMILERGNMEPAGQLIEAFLGRKSSSDAFFEKLGISSR